MDIFTQRNEIQTHILHICYHIVPQRNLKMHNRDRLATMGSKKKPSELMVWGTISPHFSRPGLMWGAAFIDITARRWWTTSHKEADSAGPMQSGQATTESKTIALAPELDLFSSWPVLPLMHNIFIFITFHSTDLYELPGVLVVTLKRGHQQHTISQV